eukprot:227767-Lingulodinium_polyedra.AAC.1
MSAAGSTREQPVPARDAVRVLPSAWPVTAPASTCCCSHCECLGSSGTDWPGTTCHPGALCMPPHSPPLLHSYPERHRNSDHRPSGAR